MRLPIDAGGRHRWILVLALALLAFGVAQEHSQGSPPGSSPVTTTTSTAAEARTSTAAWSDAQTDVLTTALRENDYGTSEAECIAARIKKQYPSVDSFLEAGETKGVIAMLAAADVLLTLPARQATVIAIPSRPSMTDRCGSCRRAQPRWSRSASTFS